MSDTFDTCDPRLQFVHRIQEVVTLVHVPPSQENRVKRIAAIRASLHGHHNKATYAQLYPPVQFIPIVTFVLVTEPPAEEME